MFVDTVTYSHPDDPSSEAFRACSCLYYNPFFCRFHLSTHPAPLSFSYVENYTDASSLTDHVVGLFWFKYDCKPALPACAAAAGRKDMHCVFAGYVFCFVLAFSLSLIRSPALLLASPPFVLPLPPNFAACRILSFMGFDALSCSFVLCSAF